MATPGRLRRIRLRASTGLRRRHGNAHAGRFRRRGGRGGGRRAHRNDTLCRLDTLPAIAAALAEETAKLIAPLAVLVLTRHRRAADGLLVGVACGAGFAVMETMGYSAVALVQSHQNLVAVEGLLLQRGLFSPATHMAWTGLTAAALWQAAGPGWRPRSVAVLVTCFATAMALHTGGWDSASTIPAYLVIAAISLGLLALTSRQLRRTQSSPH